MTACSTQIADPSGVALVICRRLAFLFTVKCNSLAVFPIYRDFPGILIVLILKTSGMGLWYLWDFDCLIPRQTF